MDDQVFPEPESPDLRPQGWRETIARFLARSTMPVALDLRAWINESLTLAPASARADLVGRLRGADDKYRSAIWELACARVLTALGYELEWHPTLPDAENSKHPDWLVHREDASLFYFEARVIEEEPDPEEARIIDELNKVNSPDFWLMPVKIVGRGERSASTRKLRDFVEAHVNALVWRAPGAAPTDNPMSSAARGTRPAYPRCVWQHDGWTIEIGFEPKSAGRRANALDRPVGMHVGQFTQCKVAEQLKKQVKKKISKYGRLDLPLVVAVRVVDIAHDDQQVLDALLGTTIYRFTPGGDDGTWSRKRDGLLAGASGMTARRLSALLVASRLNVVAPEASRVRVWFHPEPHHALDRELLPLASTSWDRSTGEKIDEAANADWDELMRRPLGAGASGKADALPTATGPDE